MSAPGDQSDADPPPVSDQHRREWRRLELERRRARRRRLIGGLGVVAVVGSVAVGAYLFIGGTGSEPVGASAGSTEREAAPVRVELEPVPDSLPEESEEPAPADAPDPASDQGASPGDPAGEASSPPGSVTPATPSSGSPRAGPDERPVVWVQAGHAEPREPGYRDQTGASSGPFGSEIGFTTNLAPKVVAALRRAGVDARSTPGEVTPLAAGGAVFVSLHHDIPEGAAAFGHAITGAGENYYRGEGSGDPSPVPYPDSAPHRPATEVTPAVERRSLELANRIAARFRPIYTPANGARGRYAGVQSRDSNPRMVRYYGFYRSNADARVIVEAGAGTTDDAFLARTDLIATAVSAGVLDHLRSRGLLGP